MRPWDGIITDEDRRAYDAAGFGRAAGIGRRPALLIIDVQYRTTGSIPMPFGKRSKSIQRHAATSHGRLLGISAGCSNYSGGNAGLSSSPMSRRRFGRTAAGSQQKSLRS